jgi:hypothetical protein
MVTAMGAVNIGVNIGANIGAMAPPAWADDGILTVEVLKYVTPEFGVRLANLDKGTPPVDITGPADSERDMDGGQMSHFYAIRPGGRPATATAFYDVEQNGQLLGTFRVDMNLGQGGDPNNLEVTCNEQLAPVDCYAFENPFIVRVYPKDPARKGVTQSLAGGVTDPNSQPESAGWRQM